MTLSDKLEEKAASYLERFDRSTAELIIWEVIRTAASYWSGLDEDDFCIQSSSGEQTIVFGGTNRLIWSITRGFYPDRSYCTQRFLDRCKELDPKI